MAHILPHLPLLMVVRMLPLQDSLNLSLTCSFMFDFVLYVYSHMGVLDFSYTLAPEGYIHLPDAFIMHILLAHTRAHTVLNLNLPPWFYAFNSLNWYFKFYLHPKYGGHAQGRVEMVGSDDDVGCVYCKDQYKDMTLIFEQYCTKRLSSCILPDCGEDFDYPLQPWGYPVHDTVWCTGDIDQPYDCAFPGCEDPDEKYINEHAPYDSCVDRD